MAWKPTGRPDGAPPARKWVVRVDGIDTETGKRRPRQLGTFASRRVGRAGGVVHGSQATSAASAARVGQLVDSWAASRVDVWQQDSDCSTSGRPSASPATSAPSASTGSTARTWPAGSRTWPPAATTPGAASRSSAWCCARRWPTPWHGRARRSPAHESACPARRQAGPPTRDRGVDRGGSPALPRLHRLSPVGRHRSALPCCTGCAAASSSGCAGRPSTSSAHGAHRARPGRGPRSPGVVGRQERSVPADDLWSIQSTVRSLAAHRRLQAEERLRAGPLGDNDLVVATRTGTPVSPGNFDHTLERLITKAGVPRLSSHGLRHTAATRWSATPPTSARSVPPPTARPQPRHADADVRPRPARIDQR